MIARTAVSLLAAAALSLAAAPPASAATKPCGKVSLGFTSAKVRGEGMSCPAAREVFQAWRRVMEEESDGGPGPRRVRVGPFGCVLGGHGDHLVKLRCRDGGKVMKARWGG
ncbi:MAG TPA: hypothetical protein VIL49_02120 [Capillimicrobium sp.]|jgi:hypothetical protein